MQPSKENCAKCNIKDVCPLRVAEGEGKETPMVEFLELLGRNGTVQDCGKDELLAKGFHELLDKIADGFLSSKVNNLPALISRINKGFNEKNALDANTLSEALITIDQRLNALEEQHSAAKQHHADKADSTKH